MTTETTNKLTRREACVLLMQSALIEPVAVEYTSVKEARRWRDSCYRIKQSLAAIGDHRFNELLLSVNNTTLTVRYKYS